MMEYPMDKKGKGRPKVESHKLHLALPSELGDWVATKATQNPFCRSRQDYIVAVLKEKYLQENSTEQLELNVWRIQTKGLKNKKPEPTRN